MKLNLNSYRYCIPFLKLRMEHRPHESLAELCGNISASTFIPICALYYYVAEINGMTPEIQEAIDRLTTFYKYTEIEGL